MRAQVERSMLAPHAADVRVIPNGVDTMILRPADRARVRAALGLPADRDIVLLTTGSRGSMWKDDRTLHRVTAALGERRPAPLFIAVGRESALRGDIEARSIPFVSEPRVMAQYYQAADLYLHAARADTFPLAVLEAMACGTPVIGTSVGGVAEQIDPHTGILVAPGDAAAMAAAAAALLDDAARRDRLGRAAVETIARQFTLTKQAGAYLAWYRELVGQA
jgi:glycosyltransferase involved in cell wall biosynthesis